MCYRKDSNPTHFFKNQESQMSFRLALLSMYFITSGIAIHQSLFTFIFTSITSPPGHLAHFKYSGNAKYFKLLQTHNLWFELKMSTPSSSTPLQVFRKLENRHISKVNYSLIKLTLVNFDFNQLTFTTALQETLIYSKEKPKMADFLNSLIFLASVIFSSFNIFHV